MRAVEEYFASQGEIKGDILQMDIVTESDLHCCEWNRYCLDLKTRKSWIENHSSKENSSLPCSGITYPSEESVFYNLMEKDLEDVLYSEVDGVIVCHQCGLQPTIPIEEGSWSCPCGSTVISDIML